MKYDYVWQVVLEDSSIIEHPEEHSEVGPAGDLSFFDQRTFLGFEIGGRIGGTTYAAGEWISFSPFIIDNTDQEDE